MDTLGLRPQLDDLNHLGAGKRTRLHRLLYQFGPGNGTILLLPIDQGLEHGPRDFFANPESANPEFQLRLAKEGGFSGIVFQIGLAEKYYWKYAVQIPLVLKLNGKTSIPSEKMAFSPLTSTVRDAVRLGADAVGYTIYVGSPLQDQDFLQFLEVREESDTFGMPLIVWSYPRGEAIDAKGGRDSLFAVDYAARVADELGADVVKLNEPEDDPEKLKSCPAPYSTLYLSPEEAMAKVVKTANRTMVLVSGGSKIGDGDLLNKVRLCMNAGCTGLIFGRNLWQRKFDDALQITAQIKRIMQEY